MIRLSHIPRFSSKFLLGDIIATKCLLRHPRWKEMVAVCLLDSNHPIIPDGKLMQILSIQSNDTKNEPLQKVAGSHFPWIFHDSRCTTRGNMWKWHAMKRKKPGMACLPEPRLPHIDFWVFNSVWPQLFHPAAHFKASGIYSTFTGIHKIRFWKATMFFSTFFFLPSCQINTCFLQIFDIANSNCSSFGCSFSIPLPTVQQLFKRHRNKTSQKGGANPSYSRLWEGSYICETVKYKSS